MVCLAQVALLAKQNKNLKTNGTYLPIIGSGDISSFADLVDLNRFVVRV